MATSRAQPGQLRDYLKPGARILFVGINPGIRSAAVGHHFAGPSNRFWKLLFDSRLVDEPLTYEEDWRLPEWRLGLTNIIRRSSIGIGELSPAEYKAGRASLERKIRRHRPWTIAFLGVTIYRILFPHLCGPTRLDLGPTRSRLAGAPVFLLPNPSGRNAHYSYDQMLGAFTDCASTPTDPATTTANPIPGFLCVSRPSTSACHSHRTFDSSRQRGNSVHCPLLPLPLIVSCASCSIHLKTGSSFSYLRKSNRSALKTAAS